MTVLLYVCERCDWVMIRSENANILAFAAASRWMMTRGLDGGGGGRCSGCRQRKCSRTGQGERGEGETVLDNADCTLYDCYTVRGVLLGYIWFPRCDFGKKAGMAGPKARGRESAGEARCRPARRASKANRFQKGRALTLQFNFRVTDVNVTSSVPVIPSTRS